MVDTTETYDWGTLIWHRHGGMLSGTMRINPGQVCGRHLHDNANETVIVSDGMVTLQFGEESLLLETGMSHFVPACTPHELATAPGEHATVTILFDNPDRTYIPLLSA